jgi:hypothetical protein
MTHMICRCGGQFRVDGQFLVDAERFGFLGKAPMAWRCCMCGRTRLEPVPGGAGASRAAAPRVKLASVGARSARRPHRSIVAPPPIEHGDLTPDRIAGTA